MSEAIVRHREDRGLHTLTMDHGANALDIELITELRERIALLRSAAAPPLLIDSSHPTLFSPGWDLKRLVDAGRDQVGRVLDGFNRLVLELFSYPGPTAAAVAGHAVAGGCLLALACDVRVMAGAGPRLGLAELNLGVPVPVPSVRMLAARLAPPAFEDLVLRGDGFAAERARELGLVQRVAPAAEVGGVTETELRRLAAKAHDAFAATKQSMFRDTWRAMTSSAEDEETFLACWFSDDTRARIAEVARTLS